jgi:ketosteroid isomerase-like protein
MPVSSTQPQLIHGDPGIWPEIADLEARWIEAFNRADIDALVALYRPDAMFYGSLPSLYVGHAGVREYFTSIAIADVQAHVEEQKLVRLHPELVFLSALVCFSGPKAGARFFRITWAIANDGVHWLIAQHHGSLRPEAP